MSRIRILPSQLINRIAAGEVVERPASVVKELVENSLDAGAGSVEIRLLAGGKQRIEIADDGCGIAADEARLALERHATSKLSNVDDLESIATLGFRGEALSSIAAVSHFMLRTAVADGEGTELTVRAGEIVAQRTVGLPRGTTVRVERLFGNVPARRKFLRADSTELSHAVRGVTRLALTRPAVRFQLEHGERRLLELGPADDLRDRIVQLHGREFAGRLLPFDARHADVRTWGFAGRPADALPRRDAQYVFVNGRAVQDRVLLHAVSQAYANTMPRDRHAGLFLFVEIDPREVDVNVHPQKSEVRFRHGSAVHEIVCGALAQALGHEAAVPRLTELRPDALEAVRESTRRFVERQDVAFAASSSGAGYTLSERIPTTRPGDRELASEVQPTLGDRAPLPVPLAQFRESYIVAQDAEGLVLVDQHAAHERVLFERYLAEAEANRVEVQRLMFPVTVELTAAETVLVEGEIEELRRLGFRIEPFGERTFRLDAVPAVAGGLDAEEVLREILGEAARCKAAAAGVRDLRYRLVTTAACKAAIKIHHKLEPAEMQRLMEDLYRTGNPTTCPHGRPLVFRLSLAEIERAFDRR